MLAACCTATTLRVFLFPGVVSVIQESVFQPINLPHSFCRHECECRTARQCYGMAFCLQVGDRDMYPGKGHTSQTNRCTHGLT